MILAETGRVAAAEETQARKETMRRVLLIEDNPGDARLLRDMLNEQTSHNTELNVVECMSDAEKHLARRAVDIILLDLGLPDTQGVGTVQRARATAPSVPLVVLTGWDDEGAALQALQEGAQDYLVKGQIETRTLLRALRYAIERKILEDLRKRTELELGAAKKYMHHLVSESPSVMHAFRIEGKVLTLTWISENVERLLGYTVAEALAPGWWLNGIHEDERARVVAEANEVLAHGQISQEYRFRQKNGAYLWLRAEKRLLRDPAGRPTEVVGSWSDVTVRRTAEQRLLESGQEYRLLFDNNPHAMWVFDAETLAFLAVNDAAIRLYGYSRDEFLRMTIEELHPPRDVQALRAFLATAADRPTVMGESATHCKKDGSTFDVVDASNPIEFRGRRARLVLANDVTEKKGLEAQLAQSQKMEAVGRLAGGVAHDFNNLLGVISGYSGLLLKNLGPLHPGSKRVEQIQKAADGAAGLTRQLLAFSRKQVLQPRILDLNEVVADVEKMLVRVIGEDIRLVATPGPELGQIRADPGQIEQVLMNLAVNSRDAMPKGGGLVLETANIVLDAAYARTHPEIQPGRFVMLAVTDTGEGMDAPTLARIFEPFFTTKEVGKGTGLGLATVFGIVRQSGGSIEVESRPGDGTTFTIYFPRVEEDLSHPSPVAPVAPPPQGTETILLVEDAHQLREMIREILEGAGYTVLAASDPEDALFMIATSEAPVRLVLTDVVMPRMSGPDLARSIRIAKPEVRVLFMSGYTNDAMGRHGVLAAGVQFIQKPFAADALLRKVREAIDETLSRAN
jgi:two-component system, cell cycle sensor histidine kinase and response regulator CckA